MHKISIPSHVIDRIKVQRGRIHIFDRLNGPSTALVVIDMQNAYTAPGMPWEAPYAREIVPNVNRIASVVRQKGGRVIWVKMTLKGQEEDWSVYFNYFRRPENMAEEVKALTPGEFGHALYAALDVQPSDLTVEKKRFSALSQGSSDLDRILRIHDIDTIIIVGAITNTCCECTARDAMMLNYKTVFVSDGNAARSDEEHNASLTNILRLFGDVMTAEEVISRLA